MRRVNRQKKTKEKKEVKKKKKTETKQSRKIKEIDRDAMQCGKDNPDTHTHPVNGKVKRDKKNQKKKEASAERRL